MNKRTKQLFAALTILSVVMPLAAHAQGNPFAPYWGPLVSCVGSSESSALTTGLPGGQILPCQSFCDLLATGQNLIKFGMTILVFILAPLLLVWGGILILVSGSNPSLLQRGKKTIFTAAIGIIIALMAYIIVATFLWLLGNPTSGQNRVSWPNIVCQLPP